MAKLFALERSLPVRRADIIEDVIGRYMSFSVCLFSFVEESWYRYIDRISESEYLDWPFRFQAR